LEFQQKWRRQDQVHPTQKPVELIEWLIKSYSNEGDTILDNCIGSGTTAIACMNTGRNFIGFETDVNYFNIANERIKQNIQ
jgi:site-specific DNA-methyltransferase (adenine-specific)